MDVTTFATPPAAGVAKPGNLYADLQSRTLWLGVDPAVNAAGSVLISDIVALQAADTANLNTAKAYTNTEVAKRALLSHTHTASQITNFNSAVDARIAASPQTKSFVRGMIMLWSGVISSIGVGDLAGWALCDGANGTPDLRDKFILGAGSKSPGTKNPSSSATTSSAGTHKHVNTSATLTVAQMPAHTHTFADTAPVTGTIGAGGGHTHNVNIYGGEQDNRHIGSSGTDSILHSNVPGASAGIIAAPSHTHSFTGNTVSISGTTSSAGSGAAHTHAMADAGAHAHTVASAALRDAMPWYALAYIMKL